MSQLHQDHGEVFAGLSAKYLPRLLNASLAVYLGMVHPRGSFRAASLREFNARIRWKAVWADVAGIGNALVTARDLSRIIPTCDGFKPEIPMPADDKAQYPQSLYPFRFVARRLALLILLPALAVALTACDTLRYGYGRQAANADPGTAVPTDYRGDVLAAVHSYVNNPRNIREAAISEPVLKGSGRAERYVVCVRFNAMNTDGKYTGTKARIAVFRRGKLDQFGEATPERGPRPGELFPDEANTDRCADAVYQPFPELEKLAN
jgi:hypothetical protein